MRLTENLRHKQHVYFSGVMESDNESEEEREREREREREKEREREIVL